MRPPTVLTRATVCIRPFVPPSGQATPGAHAGTGISVRPAPLAVARITGAPFVGGCTQGTTAKIRDFKTPATTRESSSDPFYPLPLKIVTPIKIPALERYLQDYPCPGTKRYIILGFRHGFDIRFRGSFKDANARPRNLLSAISNAEKVSEAIRKEVTRGHTSGPFPFPPFPHTHCSPIGAAPKPDGSVRLILDLSSPRGDSVNDGISQEDFRCAYSKFDDAAKIVLEIGQGAYMGKVDIKHAFRICPVQPEQWPLLCFQWSGQYYTDTRLPFGSRSSPFIFNTFAIALAWIIIQFGRLQFLIHYLDDYFLANFTREHCQHDIAEFLRICEELGVPIAEDKLVGPTTTLTYLGIEIDSVAMTIRLPADKLQQIKAIIKQWLRRRKCTKRELLSLIGLLAFAAKVVKPGRMFLRRLIDLSTTVDSLHYYIYLNSEARADISWWQQFLPEWNGLAIIHPTPITTIDLKLFTDASDLGFGCVYGNHWAYGSWGWEWQPTKECNVNVRELFAVWAAVYTWGYQWANKEVVVFTDNQSIIDIWKTGTSTNKRMMRLVRAMFFHAANLNLNIIMSHIPGKLNTNADLLSRFQVEEFQRLNPTADPEPTVLPEEVWDPHGGI